MSAWDLGPKSRCTKYVYVQCSRAPLCALITLSPIPHHTHTHILPSIPHRLIELKRWPLHNLICHSSRHCDLGIAYAEAPVGMVTTHSLKGYSASRAPCGLSAWKLNLLMHNVVQQHSLNRHEITNTLLRSTALIFVLVRVCSKQNTRYSTSAINRTLRAQTPNFVL